MSGPVVFFRAPPSGWEEVVELIPPGTTWTWGAIMMDLAWWHDQERMGRRARPGRPSLCRRWGVTERRARYALAAEAEWKYECPADVQPTSSRRPAAATANAENGPETSSRRPADVQPTSTRALSTEYRVQNTDPHPFPPPGEPGDPREGKAGETMDALPELLLTAGPPLPPRVAAALAELGLRAPRAVAALTAAELKKRRGIGPQAIRDIEAWLGGQGLALVPTPPRNSPLSCPRVRAFGAAWKANYRDATGAEYEWGDWAPAASVLRRWVVACGDDLERYRRALDVYFGAEAAGSVWPAGPPTLVKASRDIPRWLNGQPPIRRGVYDMSRAPSEAELAELAAKRERTERREAAELERERRAAK